MGDCRRGAWFNQGLTTVSLNVIGAARRRLAHAAIQAEQQQVSVSSQSETEARCADVRYCERSAMRSK